MLLKSAITTVQKGRCRIQWNGPAFILPPELHLAVLRIHIIWYGSGSRIWKTLLRIRIHTELWYGSGSRNWKTLLRIRIHSKKRFSTGTRMTLQIWKKKNYFPCYMIIFFSFSLKTLRYFFKERRYFYILLNYHFSEK